MVSYEMLRKVAAGTGRRGGVETDAQLAALDRLNDLPIPCHPDDLYAAALRLTHAYGYNPRLPSTPRTAEQRATARLATTVQDDETMPLPCITESSQDLTTLRSAA